MTEACATATLPVLEGNRPDSVGKLASNVEMKASVRAATDRPLLGLKPTPTRSQD